VSSIVEELVARAGAHPDRPAIIQGRGRRRRMVTFAELAASSASVAARLRDRGIEPGQRVLLFVPMSIDLYLSLLGVLHAGAVAVFVDAWAGRRRLGQAVDAADPVAFIGTPRAHLLRLVTPALRRVPVRLWAGPGPLRIGRALGGTARPSATAPEPEPVPEDAHALVTFTTGTTGRPRAAVRTHGFLRAQHRVLARHLSLRGDDVDMPTLPVFVLNNLALGVPSVIPDFDPRRPAEVDPAAVLDQMRDEGVTTTSGSPAFYQRLATWLEEQDARGANRIPVRSLFTGGAPVFPPLARRLVERTEGDVHVLYGSTEAEPIAAVGARDLLEAAASTGALGVCAGEPVPEIDWKIVRPVDDPIPGGGPSALKDLEVGTGETGELLVAGEHVLSGYLNDPEGEARSKVRVGGRVWHRTGDGARFDGQWLWLMGRVSQRVVRAGETWWGMAAEARALSVPGVAHAAYLGWPGDGPEDGAEGGANAGSANGVRALLCVELEGSPPADLDARLRAALAPIPADEIRRLTIPRDPRHASKTDPGALREQLERMDRVERGQPA
jgi:olefin beta-lactone synthetase